jgi:type III secretory pathway component EscV
MAGSILGYVLVATSRSGWYIAIEITVPSVFILMARALGPSMGLSAVPSAYVIASLVHCSMAIVALRDVIFVRDARDTRA